MTLYSRNKLFIGIFICFVINILLVLGPFLFKLFTHAEFTLPYTFDFSSLGTILFKSNSICALLCIVFIGIFALVTCFTVIVGFEKTQSIEVLLFMGFLFGCMLEIYRLLIPIFSLWNSFSDWLLVVGKLSFSSKIIAVGSFLFAALVPQETKNQLSGRSLVLLMVVSFVFAEFIPVNSHDILPSIMPSLAFSKMFSAILVVICLITAFSLFFSDGKNFVLGYVILIFGYLILVFGSSVFTLILGASLLIVGSVKYLKSIHEFYMWQ